MDRICRKSITAYGFERLIGHREMPVERLVDDGSNRPLSADLGEDLKDRAWTSGVKPLDLATESDVGDNGRSYGPDPFHNLAHATTWRCRPKCKLGRIQLKPGELEEVLALRELKAYDFIVLLLAAIEHGPRRTGSARDQVRGGFLVMEVGRDHAVACLAASSSTYRRASTSVRNDRRPMRDQLDLDLAERILQTGQRWRNPADQDWSAIVSSR